MTPIQEGDKALTPTDYLGIMKDTQGNRPVAWARSLASLVILGVLPEEEATEYANALAGASQDHVDAFWTTYNTRIAEWKKAKD